MNDCVYYVYAYLREDGTPYYIGKGKKKRAWADHPRDNGIELRPVDLTRIKIIAHKLFEHEAYSLEKILIKQYGRKDLNTGILRNMADGGEGRTGPLVYSEEGKRIRAEKMSGDKNPSCRPEVRETKRKFMLDFWQNNPHKKKFTTDRMTTRANPNNNRVSCVVCKKETTLPILGRDHKHG
jgi:hypothetical protein